MIEITTFRADVYRPESRKPEVTYSDDITTDLSRPRLHGQRDGIAAARPGAGRPVRGCWSTSRPRRLRTPLEPEISFVDDPLRMLRAARFVAQFALEPDPALVAAVVELRHRLEIVSAERIRDELSKLLLVDDPSAGLWFLAETGLADEFLPELNLLLAELGDAALQLVHAALQRARPVLVARGAVAPLQVVELVEEVAGVAHVPAHRLVGPPHRVGVDAEVQVHQLHHRRR